MPRTIGPAGWLLLALRCLLMLLLLLVCLPLYFLWRLLGLHRFWPRVFLRGVAIVAGLRITVTGKPARRALFLPNHVSWLDIPALCGITGTAFVAHDGLAQSAPIQRLCAMNDTVMVARHDRRTVHRQVEQVRDALDDVGALTLFAEGTTSDGSELLPFKSALLSAIEPLPEGVAVQPVVISYAQASQIAWVGEEPGIENVRRILARWRPIRLSIAFLEPLSGDDLADRKTIASAAQEAVAAGLNRANALQTGGELP